MESELGLRPSQAISGYPLGTLTVNSLGCFVIGLLGGWAEWHELFTPPIRLFFFVGILGSFTTFSTFGFETVFLMKDAHFLAALGNVGLHLALGLGAVWMGYSLAS